MNKLLCLTLLISILPSLTGCKTQAQIRREQQMENLTRQVSQSQKLSADTTIRLQNMEERINHLHGALEESGYAGEIKRQESLAQIEGRIDNLEQSQNDILKKFEETQKQLDAQRSYLDQVLETLKDLSSGGDLKKKSTDELYSEAVRLYRAGEYGKSRTYFLEVLDRGVEGQTLAHSYHNMGMVEYIAGRDDDALVYFSRLFTEFPDSGYNRNGLLFMAKAFERKGQKAEARQALQQLINRFPDANRIGDAKKMLERLK